MKKIYYVFLGVIITSLSFANLYGQDTARVPSSIPPAPVPVLSPGYNAGFDVIITTNGTIINGLVKEVGLLLIKYQRTDIPDGPIYTIPRNEVYAISYRNQVKEYFSTNNAVSGNISDNDYYHRYNNNGLLNNRNRFVLTQSNFRVGLGFIRGFTKVSNVDDYSSSGTFPVINIAYDARFRNTYRLGLQMAFGSHKFSQQNYSDYDSVQTGTNVKENVFSLVLYGKYATPNLYANLRPYAIIGIGINSSKTHSESELSYTNSRNQSLLISSGSTTVGLGLLFRAGVEYYFSSNTGVYADFGSGLSILQLGVVINLQ